MKAVSNPAAGSTSASTTAMAPVSSAEPSIQMRASAASRSGSPCRSSPERMSPVLGRTPATSTAMTGSTIGDPLESRNCAPRLTATTASAGTSRPAAIARST